MLINYKQLKKLAVETQSGQSLGQVIDFSLETETGIIMQYHVKTKIGLASFIAQELIINKDQIISIDDEKIIVEDSAVKTDKAGLAIKEINKIEGTEPVITSQDS